MFGGGAREYDTRPGVPEYEDEEAPCMSGGCFGAQPEKDTMNYVGDHKGDYVQEVSYRWVGEGRGDYYQVERTERGSPFGVLCCLGVLALLAALYLLSERGFGLGGAWGGWGGWGGGGGAEESGANYRCDLRDVEPGEEVEASRDIAFRPAGFVTKGSRGTVQSILPDENRHQIVMDWQDYRQLVSSKVSRHQIYKIINVGDYVEALEDITVNSPGDDPNVLRQGDMVFAADDLEGQIAEGTFGFVTSMGSVGGVMQYTVDFPELQVRGRKVGPSDLVKAPKAGDRVKVLVDVNLGAAGELREGAEGTVSQVYKKGNSYAYSVAWEDYPQETESAKVDGIALEIVPEKAEPTLLRIPKGSLGRVMARKSSSLADSTLTVAFTDLLRDHVQVPREQVEKTPSWPADRVSFCCRTEEVACSALAAPAVRRLAAGTGGS